MSPTLCSPIYRRVPYPVNRQVLEPQTLPWTGSHRCQDHLRRGESWQPQEVRAGSPGAWGQRPSPEAPQHILQLQPKVGQQKGPVRSPETGVGKVPLLGAAPSVSEGWGSNRQRAPFPRVRTNSCRGGLPYGFLMASSTSFKDMRPEGLSSPRPTQEPRPGLRWVPLQSCTV